MTSDLKVAMRQLRKTPGFTVTAILTLAPVLIASARTSGSPFLVQGNGGLNFYIGNSPMGTGLPTVRPRAG